MAIQFNKSRNYRFFWMVCVVILIGSGIYYYAYRATSFTINESLKEIARHGAETVSTYVDAKFSQLEAMAVSEIISDPATPRAERIKYMKKIANTYDYHRVSYTDVNGASYTSENEDLYIGDRQYFIEALQGKRAISDPLQSKVNGTWMIVYAIPVFNSERKVIAVLSAAHKAEALSDFSTKIRYGNAGYSVIFDKMGNTIAHRDIKLVYARDNIIKDAKNDPSFGKLAILQERMLAGENGSGSYLYKGTRKIMGFAPINGTQWSLAVTVPHDYVFSPLDDMLRFLIIVYFLAGVMFLALEMKSHQLRGQLQRQELTAKAAVKAAELLIMDIDRNGVVIYANTFARDKLGGGSGSLIIGCKWQMLCDEEPLPESDDLMRSILTKENVFTNYTIPMKSSDGQPVYIMWNSEAFAVEDKAGRYIQLVGVNVTDKILYEKELSAKNAELSLLFERYRLSMEGSNDGMWDWDIVHDEFHMSEKCKQIFEIS